LKPSIGVSVSTLGRMPRRSTNWSQMASLTRREAYCECVMAESRTLQSTASVWAGVIHSPQLMVRTASYSSSGEWTSASRIGQRMRTAVRTQRLARYSIPMSPAK